MFDWQMKTHEDSDIVIIELTGSLETEQCDYFFSGVENRIREGDRKLILDCSNLDYISSMGLGTLLRTHARMKKQGGNVTLAAVHGVVADVLRVVRLEKIFHLYPTVEEAVASYQQ